MALLGYSKEQLRKNIFIGVGLAVVVYLGLRYGLKNYYAKKEASTPTPKPTPTPSKPATKGKNFVGADGGQSEDGFVALRYDANHVNEDGSLGATWIGYKGSDVVGYWEKGVIKIGTPINQLI